MKRFSGSPGIVLLLLALLLFSGSAPPARADHLPSLAATSAMLTADELAYLFQVAAIAEGYVDTVDAIFALLEDASETPTLILDSAWLAALSAEIANLFAITDELEALPPPERFEGIYDELLAASGHLERAAQLVIEGIEERNPAKFQEAADELLLASEGLESALAELEELEGLATEESSGQSLPTAIPSGTARPPWPTPTPTLQAAIGSVTVNADQLNVRAGPGIDYEVIGVVSRDTHLDLLESNDDGTWFLVCCIEGGAGWVYGPLVIVKGTPTPTVFSLLAEGSVPITVTLPLSNGLQAVVPLWLDVAVLESTDVLTASVRVQWVGSPVAEPVAAVPTASATATSPASRAPTATPTVTPTRRRSPVWDRNGG